LAASFAALHGELCGALASSADRDDQSQRHSRCGTDKEMTSGDVTDVRRLRRELTQEPHLAVWRDLKNAAGAHIAQHEPVATVVFDAVRRADRSFGYLRQLFRGESGR
jgi:hypothetical protein